MLKKDIDKMINDLREDLDKTFHRKAAYLQNQDKWLAFCHDAFEVSVINKTIDKYNLMVPMMRSQKFHVDLDKEASKCWTRNQTCKAVSDDRAEVVKRSETDPHAMSNASLFFKRLTDFMSNKVKT